MKHLAILLLLLAAPVLAQPAPAGLPDLAIFFDSPGTIDPDVPMIYSLRYGNFGSVPATDIRASIDLPEGTTIGPVDGATCTVAGVHLDCALGDLPARPPAPVEPTFHQILIHVKQVARFDAPTLLATASIRTAAGDDAFPLNNDARLTYPLARTFVVTTTADDGEGSLRRAIESANASTDPQPKIGFHIDEPLPASGWYTIAPRTPLPAITREVSVDGTFQTRIAGDTNPLGPEIEISGRELREGNGLFVTACRGFNLYGVAINGFPQNGVVITSAGPPCQPALPTPERLGTISDCFIGTDPTGSRAVPNGLRAIAIVVPPPEYATYLYFIERNVLSGNRLSGIWAPLGPPLAILNNRIGVAAHSDAPLPNGASGVYLAASYSTIQSNVIANARDFGIAVDGSAVYVDFSGNSIYDNGQLGIDVGLNGPGGGLPPPVLTSARYDPVAGTTTVQGTLTDRGGTAIAMVELYANDHVDAQGNAEAQTPIAQASLGSMSGHRDFTVTVKGNYSGKIITAVSTIREITGFAKPPGLSPDDNRFGEADVSSEISNGVPVQ